MTKRAMRRLTPPSIPLEGFGNLGYICAQTGSFPEARHAFEQALQIKPEDTLAAGLLRQLP